MGKLTFLIIHCTATPAGRKVTSDDIRRWHLIGRGWKQVGYTDMIHLDGTVENLVKHDENDIIEPWEITNGVAGENSISRSIVYVGGLCPDGANPMDTRTQDQLAALETYVLNCIKKHPEIMVAGHNQFAAKACPSFDVPTWLESINVDKKNIYLPKGYKRKLFPALASEPASEKKDGEPDSMEVASLMTEKDKEEES
jgi:hypothetical protein